MDLNISAIIEQLKALNNMSTTNNVLTSIGTLIIASILIQRLYCRYVKNNEARITVQDHQIEV